jgi:hypothetical protein
MSDYTGGHFWCAETTVSSKPSSLLPRNNPFIAEYMHFNAAFTTNEASVLHMCTAVRPTYHSVIYNLFSCSIPVFRRPCKKAAAHSLFECAF